MRIHQRLKAIFIITFLFSLLSQRCLATEYKPSLTTQKVGQILDIWRQDLERTSFVLPNEEMKKLIPFYANPKKTSEMTMTSYATRFAHGLSYAGLVEGEIDNLFIVALLYLKCISESKAYYVTPDSARIKPLSHLTIHTLFLVSCVMAGKMLLDSHPDLNFWAEVGGVKVPKLTCLEIEFFNIFRGHIPNINPDQFFQYKEKVLAFTPPPIDP